MFLKIVGALSAEQFDIIEVKLLRLRTSTILILLIVYHFHKLLNGTTIFSLSVNKLSKLKMLLM